MDLVVYDGRGSLLISWSIPDSIVVDEVRVFSKEFGSEKFIITDSKEEISVSKRIILSGENLIDAQPKFDNLNNQPIVSFSLDRLGSQRFGRVTTENIGKRLAIVLDNEAISAPVIQDSITGGNGTISGNFTFQTATDLALLLRSGACLLYTSPSPRDRTRSRMPSSA